MVSTLEGTQFSRGQLRGALRSAIISEYAETVQTPAAHWWLCLREGIIDVYEHRSIARSPQQSLATTTRERSTAPSENENTEFDALFDATFRDLAATNSNTESGTGPSPVRSEAGDSAVEATHTMRRAVESKQASYHPTEPKMLPRPGKVPRPAQVTMSGVGHRSPCHRRKRESSNPSYLPVNARSVNQRQLTPARSKGGPKYVHRSTGSRCV